MQIELNAFYSRLGSIVLILALGFLLGKIKFINKITNKSLVNLLLSVFMPASLFAAFPPSYNEDSANLFFSGILAGLLVMTLLILLSRLLFNKKIMKSDNLRLESQFGLIFNNATFLGYPIVASTFGGEGIIAYCGFIIVFNIALFSYGVFLFKKKFNLKLILTTLINPNILAVVFGMIVFFVGIKLPAFITDAVGFVSGATTPLSIICVGYMLSTAHVAHLVKKWKLIIPAAVQLIIGPLVTFFTLRVLNFPDIVVAVCTLIQALPTATSLSLFATKYGGDEVESSELVVVSTLLSIVTLPLMITILFH